MSDPSLVWIATGRLTMLPPNGYVASHPSRAVLTFHRWHARQWERSACGLPYERNGRQAMVALRRDTAELIADPCRICWPIGGR